MRPLPISAIPQNSTNGRFHKLGFVRHYEKGPKGHKLHVYTKGDLVLKFAGVDQANEWLNKQGEEHGF